MDHYFSAYLNTYKEVWYATSPKAMPKNKGNQRHNSQRLKGLKQQLILWLKANPKAENFADPEMQSQLKKVIIPFMNDVLEVEEWVCNFLDQEGYDTATTDFINRAKEEFPDINFQDIFQALRNVWVLLSLQVYMGEPVEMTDAVYAYSMLYPLTDNYLDSPTVPRNEKEAFNQKFAQKIKGEHITTSNQSEKAIFHMIDIIHTRYPQTTYPEVTESLLAILDGQNRSLQQQHMATLYDCDLVEQTFYKGGSSVLADAYLVRGTLTENEALFAYGYGVILQLADDLQDLTEDLQEGHSTMLNTEAHCHGLDRFMDKYTHFIHWFFKDIYQVEHQNQLALKQLLLTSIDLLIYSGTVKQKAYFSRSTFKHFQKNARFSASSFNYKNTLIQKMMENI